MSEEIEQVLAEQGLIVPKWDRAQPGRKQPLPPAFEMRLRRILSAVAKELGVNMGPIMGHRLCGTNGNHAYGCLICAKQDRYCQLFQLHQYGETIATADNQKLKQLLRERAAAAREQIRLAQATRAQPTPKECA